MTWGKTQGRRTRWRKKRKNGVIFMGRTFHVSEFARRNGLSKSIISLYLSGKRPVDRMSIEMAELFSTAFNCSIEDLVGHLREKRRLLPPKL